MQPHEPDSDSVEDFAARYIRTTSLLAKCSPAAPPGRWQAQPEPCDIRPVQRPAELVMVARASRTPRQRAMGEPRARAQLLHTFWFHELQAAELMCWALLRFCDAEQEFRRGLLRIWHDEVRHMRMYQEHIEALGFGLGDFNVRDWFWQRVPECKTKTMFVALLGMGLEAANLEHSARFAEWFRAAGDLEGARLQEQVGREEIGHVRFATRWFKTWTGGDDFDQWLESLPKPLSPLLMRGKTVNREARLKAGMSQDFIYRLTNYRPEATGRGS